MRVGPVCRCVGPVRNSECNGESEHVLHFDRGERAQGGSVQRSSDRQRDCSLLQSHPAPNDETVSRDPVRQLG